MKKRFLMPEAYWDTALLERWLEEKAVQGWRPVSFSRYGSGKFEPAEPRKLRYRLGLRQGMFAKRTPEKWN